MKFIKVCFLSLCSLSFSVSATINENIQAERVQDLKEIEKFKVSLREIAKKIKDATVEKEKSLLRLDKAGICLDITMMRTDRRLESATIAIQVLKKINECSLIRISRTNEAMLETCKSEYTYLESLSSVKDDINKRLDDLYSVYCE